MGAGACEMRGRYIAGEVTGGVRGVACVCWSDPSRPRSPSTRSHSWPSRPPSRRPRGTACWPFNAPPPPRCDPRPHPAPSHPLTGAGGGGRALRGQPRARCPVWERWGGKGIERGGRGREGVGGGRRTAPAGGVGGGGGVVPPRGGWRGKGRDSPEAACTRAPFRTDRDRKVQKDGGEPLACVRTFLQLRRGDRTEKGAHWQRAADTIFPNHASDWSQVLIPGKLIGGW